MHFSIYVRLLDLLWEHLDDEDRFRQLAHEAVERPGVAVNLIFNLGKARAEFARRIAAQHAQGSAE